MKVKRNKICYIICVLILLNFSFIYHSNVYATESTRKEITEIQLIERNQNARVYDVIDYLVNERFYIKNMYTGKYLDIAGGVSDNGTNVQQYEFNGSDAQKWGIYSYGNGEYSIVSYLGSSGNTFSKVLDISGGLDGENINAHVWDYNGGDAQKFTISATNFSTYVIFTKASNYGKCVQLDGTSCSNGNNVDQYSWVGEPHQCWILEPITPIGSFGVRYAQANYQHYVKCYPDARNLGGDCANFVSQCMLASGMHYQDDWKVYRKNGNYDAPINKSQLNDSWELCSPKTSPWISAPKFGEYWRNQKTNYGATGQQILDNPSIVWGAGLIDGDVIQYGHCNLYGIPVQSDHTMYVTGKDSNSYLLTYHSNPLLDKNLLDICKQLPDRYFWFYRMI